MGSQLEELCRPLILQLCEYCNCARAGAPIDTEQLKWEMQIGIDDIHRKCEQDPSLQREFQRIEQPLVFFIDYTIKEGHFPFSSSWQPIARSYKELSGDEKFFDLLAETLDDPDSAERLRMFYTMMGLGFDGCCKGDGDYIERRMKLCAVRTSVGTALDRNTLLNDTAKQPKRRYHVFRYSRKFWKIFWVCILLTVGALAWNCWQFFRMTGDFRRAIGRASDMLSQIVQSGKSEVKNEKR